MGVRGERGEGEITTVADHGDVGVVEVGEHPFGRVGVRVHRAGCVPEHDGLEPRGCSAHSGCGHAHIGREPDHHHPLHRTLVQQAGEAGRDVDVAARLAHRERRVAVFAVRALADHR